MKTILITGASGFTGQHACRHFVQKGLQVAAISRSQRSSESSVQSWICDLTKHEQVKELVAQLKPDYVMHLAGRNAVAESWREPIAYMENNMMSTFYLLDALRCVPECRIVVVGSMLTYVPTDSQKPPHPYSMSKSFQTWGALDWAHLFEQKVMIASPSNLIGPGPSNGICGLLARASVQVEAGINGAPFKLSSLVEERDYLDVRDAVAAYDLILEHGVPGCVYPVASGINLSLGQIAHMLQQLLVKKLTIEAGQISSYKPPARIDITQTLRLGWNPNRSLEESLRDALTYFRQQG
ncbi:NAD-dependent epimerase/dehydratase family protein [Paenibacillus alginolyticus]|uniref:SDR family NAD(P)-dependent oxidoreductase n=1 Tax=Paenibacillus alginolyticus TaxID=59839 RepID=A0ABT4GDX4_9BACL|nr:SDR family NAD(P)-dependent oxidoreductase [Paenibacillus alginolyticus]MCY9694377.1 SDR family NAD(P)-dependent oxidoreductase [Paenibacillus alginolyticus]MEC0147546.1 SDR family NAD(P)-dependent oxidoreductase [Paenibacillus alginolyticus]